MTEKSNRIVLKGIANWPNLAQPKGINGSPAKYSLCLIIPKDDIETLNKYQAALEAARGSEEATRLGLGWEQGWNHALWCLTA